MSPARGASSEPGLFDPPLEDSGATGTEPPVLQPDGQGNLPLFPDGARPPARLANGAGSGPEGEADALEEPAAEERERLRPVSLRRRVIASGADLVVHAGVLAGGLSAMALLGLEPRVEDWPGLLLYLLAFSFLYTVVPLAFWGQTPGMAWSGARALDAGECPLTFGQTALRWLGGLLTVSLLGLPGLMALGGRSLTDRLSRSRTYQAGA